MNSTFSNHGFKKGDKVYSYCLSPDSELEGRALVCAQALTLTSMGKRQGTAIYTSGGQVLTRRIYPDTQLVADLEAVTTRARAEYKDYSERLIARRLEAANEWLTKYEFTSKASVVAQVKAKRDYLMIAQPSCRVWIHDGENTTETIL